MKNAPAIVGVTTPVTSEDVTAKPYLPPTDPLDKDQKQARARVILRDIPITVIADHWTYERVRGALESHCAGMFFESAQLWEAIMGDARVQAVVGSRVGALLGLPVDHTPSTTDGENTPESDEVLEAWKKAYPKLCTRAVLSEIKRWTIGLGFAIAQVQWNTEVTPWQPYLKVWHPQFIYYRWDTRSYWVMTQDGVVEVTPGDGTWFLHGPNGDYRGWMYGAIRALALPWLLRTFALRDWARYCEVHGMPMMKAITPAVGFEDAKAEFTNALQSLGTETVVELPQGIDGQGFDLELLEASDRAWEAFKGLKDTADIDITLAVVWQNLTTEVKEGSMAAARVHGDVKQSCLEFDESTLVADIHEELARPFALYNFGNADLAPFTHYRVEPIEDEAAAMKALLDFSLAVQQLRAAGVSFDLHRLAKNYGVRMKLEESEEKTSKSGQIFEYHYKYGLIKKNEGRKSIGFDEVPGGDEFVSAATVTEQPADGSAEEATK